MSKRQITSPLLAALAALPVACLIPTATENEIGAEQAEKIARQMPILRDEKLNGYVAAVTERLAAHAGRKDVDYTIQVVDRPEPNAFALPGGYLYVSRGLLALVNSEDELAGVIGHEIGHVEARHSVRRIGVAVPFAIVSGLAGFAVGIVSPWLGDAVAGTTQVVSQGLVVAPYERSQERDADSIGLRLAAKAGYDPRGLPDFLHTLSRDMALTTGEEESFHFLASHPTTPKRVRDTREEAEALKPAAPTPGIAPTRKALLERIEGIAVGENAAEGVFRDALFLHPDMNFVIEFPEGWKTVNTQSAVYASAEAGDGVVALEVVAEGDDPAAYFEKVNADNDGELRPTLLKIGSLDAIRTGVEKRGRGGTQTIELTWIGYQGQIYQVTGVMLKRRAAEYQPLVRAWAESFRPLTSAQRRSITQDRLRIARAREGESLVALADRMGTPWEPERVAVANALQEGATLDAGALVKVSIAEPY